MFSINMAHTSPSMKDRRLARELKADDGTYRHQASGIVDSGNNTWKVSFDELQKLLEPAPVNVLNPIEVACSAVLQYCDISRLPLIVQTWLSSGSPVLLEAVKLITANIDVKDTWGDGYIRANNNTRDDMYRLINRIAWYSPCFIQDLYKLTCKCTGNGDANDYIYKGMTAYDEYVEKHPAKDHDSYVDYFTSVDAQKQMRLSLTELNAELGVLQERLVTIESKPSSKVIVNVISGITENITEHTKIITDTENDLASLELELEETCNSTSFKHRDKIEALTVKCTAEAIETANVFVSILTGEFNVDRLITEEDDRIHWTARDILDNEEYRNEKKREIRYNEIVKELKAASPIYGKLKGLTFEEANRRSIAFNADVKDKADTTRKAQEAVNLKAHDDAYAARVADVVNSPGYVNLKGMSTADAKIALRGDYVMTCDR